MRIGLRSREFMENQRRVMPGKTGVNAWRGGARPFRWCLAESGKMHQTTLALCFGAEGRPRRAYKRRPIPTPLGPSPVHIINARC